MSWVLMAMQGLGQERRQGKAEGRGKIKPKGWTRKRRGWMVNVEGVETLLAKLDRD